MINEKKLRESAEQIKNVCSELKEQIGKVQSEIIIPAYKKLTKEERKQFEKEMEQFIEGTEIPDLRSDFVKFANQYKKG